MISKAMASASSDPFFEKRAAERRRFNVGAFIHVSGSLEPMSCSVLDISREGARLETEHSASLPEEFAVTIANNTFGARVVWRREKELGVQFVYPDDDA